MPSGRFRKSQNVGWADDRKPNKIKIIDFYYLSKPAFYGNLHRERVGVGCMDAGGRAMPGAIAERGLKNRNLMCGGYIFKIIKEALD